MSLETFPDDIASDATAGPTFLTDVIVLQSGFEQRNVNWFAARWKATVRVPGRNEARSQKLVAFFRAVAGGRANKFRVRDWSDYVVPDAYGAGVFSMLTATTFQAYKRYTVGAATHDRKITRLRGTPTSVTGGSGLSWDLDTGILTVASGTPTAWAGEFDVPCRLDTDGMQWHMLGSTGRAKPLIEWDSVPLIEVRE